MAKARERKQHLGKGLDALLGSTFGQDILNEEHAEKAKFDFPPDKKLKESLQSVPVAAIKANPYQPRQAWNQKELEELAISIQTNGMIQPILLRKDIDGYQIIAGERRFRAAQLLDMQEVPAIVREASDEQMLELALIENIHREDLNPIDRALAYRQYLDSFGLNQSDGAKRLGEDRSVISNYLRLLDLPKEVKEMLTRGDLSMGHARALLGLPGDELRMKIARLTLTNNLSVREVESLVRKTVEKTQLVEKAPRKEKTAHILDLENRLRECLGTKVTINAKKGGQKGKIIIEFYSLDEFDRLSERMGIMTSDMD